MKIDGTHNINKIPNINSIPKKNIPEVNKVNPPVRTETHPSATYQKSTSNHSLQTYDLQSIEKLMKESENIYAQLKEIVEDMLINQDKLSNMFSRPKPLIRPGILQPSNPLKLSTDGDLSEELIMKIKDLIESEGKHGVETMSEKISDIVNRASNGEKVKIEILRELIDEVFKDGQVKFGQLSDLSLKTYDKIMEKLDSLLSSENIENLPVNPSKALPEGVKLELDLMIGDMVTSQAKTLALIKGADLSGLSLNETSLAEAKNLIRPDGLLGVIAMSRQVIKFAKESAGGDPDNLADIINQIKKNFSEVKNILGDLPDITEDTYELIIEKLEEDLLELSKKGLVNFDKFMNLLQAMRENQISIQRYALVAGGASLLYYALRILF